MGLLGDSWDDPKTMATMQLAAGLLGGGNFGQAAGRGLAGYQAQMAAAQEQELRRQQMQAQQAKADEYRSRMEGAKATQQRDVQFQQALQQRVPPAELARYFPEKVDLIQKLAGARNFGRDEVARTAEVEGPGGSKVIQGYSKYGDEVGQGANGYVAPQGVNLGGSYTFAKPVAGQSFQITQDPNSIASNAITLRGQNMTDARARERLEMDRAQLVDGVKPVKQGPMSVTLQKELLESDDVKQSSKAIVDMLGQAKAINKDAYSGYFAKGRAQLASNLPGNYSGANATIDLDNMMTGQALESLKAVFGGMPTEGERKILLDMQASSEKTPQQREAIMDRAIAAAQRRGAFAENKAKSIRTGTYLTEGVPEPVQMKPKTNNGWSIQKVD